MNNRLALGTVQFGLMYGVANTSGQVSLMDARTILDEASHAGLDTIDTAMVYGDSERRLGEIGVDHWHVVSKLPSIPVSCTDIADWVDESVRGSLARLRIKRLHGLLLHDSRELKGEDRDALYQALREVKERGLVEKIGLSIYGVEELEGIWSRYSLDIVQAPFNIIDRRLASSGWLGRLRAGGAEIHVRSVFLQGLLLMDSRSRPSYFRQWQGLWEHWDRWLSIATVSPLQACLAFVASYPEIDRVIVGVDNPRQFHEVVAAFGSVMPPPPDEMASEDPDLINPSRWSVN